MKIGRWFLLGALLITAIVTCWLLFMPQKVSPPRLETKRAVKPQPAKTTQATSETPLRAIPPKPRLFKMHGYPPTTPEHRAMWDWWHAMEKADPKFQWKMPIEFYGKVIDQFGEPVAGASVHIVWTAVDDAHEITKSSAPDGTFEFTGEHGKGITVDVLKEGYLRTKQWIQNFEYAAFFDYRFHVPDKSQPAIFRLQKLVGAEPMLKFLADGDMAVSSAPAWLDVETGKLGLDGDLSFGITTGAEGQRGPSYAITITAANGAAFAFSEEEFMFRAPESGYRTSVILNKLASESNYSRVLPFRFYVKTRSGKYAAVEGDITIREGVSEGKASLHAMIYHNPSGSRNLEFDQRKWLNR